MNIGKASAIFKDIHNEESLNMTVLRYLSGHVACTKKDRPSIKKA